MRILCLYLPALPLQVQVRRAPHLAGAPLGVLLARSTQAQSPSGPPRIVAVSRAALAAGVRVGMTALQARAAAPEALLVDGAPAAWAEARCALAEALLAFSVTVDISDPSGLFAQVPSGVRGATFGEQALEAAAGLGLIARAGIADDRFSAWVATQFAARQFAATPLAATPLAATPLAATQFAATQFAATQPRPHAPVWVVPPGGSARFLAPLPLGLLPVGEAAARTLALLGVRTIGDFAALPAPSIGRRFPVGEINAHELAQGRDPRSLTPFFPDEPICEFVDLECEMTELEPLAFMLRPLLERVARRLVGRGRAAARVALTLSGPGGASTRIELVPAHPTPSARTLVELARAHLAERTLVHPVTTVATSVVEESELEARQTSLFERDDFPHDALELATQRLTAAFGEAAVFGTRLRERHRPEGSWEPIRFSLPDPRVKQRPRPKPALPAPHQLAPTLPLSPGALRLLDPPTPLASPPGSPPNPSATPSAPGGTLQLLGALRRIVTARGPLRLEGEWWAPASFARDYYEVTTDDGGRYWLYRDRVDGRLYLHGVLD